LNADKGEKQTMRILIADDEAKARSRLAAMLADYSAVEICGEAGDGITALEAIERLNPDVVLLDVQMPGLDGFEVIRELTGPKAPLIVFVTGFDKYAIQAFEVSAVDFLLKPITEDRLKQALEKAKRILQSEMVIRSMEAMEQIHRLTEALAAGQTSYMQRVVGRRKSKSHILPVSDIQAFVCTDELVYAVTTNQERSLLNHTLKDLEDRLNPKRFVRVHRQVLVNIDHITEIDQTPKGDGSAKLRCGLAVDLSRRYLALLKEKLAG
jgi:two-component system, LytTR family, response regulator